MISYARNSAILLFFLTLSHALMIQQRKYKGYNSVIEFIIIGQSRHEKDLVLCLMRILARCVEVLR